MYVPDDIACNKPSKTVAGHGETSDLLPLLRELLNLFEDLTRGFYLQSLPCLSS